MKASESKRPKRYDSEDSKRRLLKAALDVFSNVGYDAATTRTIARKAGVNDSLIQRYFGGKLGLLISLIHQFHEASGKSSFESPKDSLEEELSSFFQNKLSHLRKHKKFLRIAVSRAILDPKVRAEVAHYAKTRTPELITRLEELTKEQKLRGALNLHQVSRLLSVVAFAMGLLTEIIGSMDLEQAEELLPLAAKILAAGLK